MTEHARKRMNFLLGMPYEKREIEFRKRFLLSGSPPMLWFHGLRLEDIPLFAGRCALFSVKILEFEVSLESHYPLYIQTYEDYMSEFDPHWWKLAIEHFDAIGVTEMIIPSIQVPESVLNDYL